MNPIDIGIFVILLLGFIWGFRKGFVYMIFSLIAILVGLFTAGKLTPLIIPYLFSTESSKLGYIVIFIIIFTLIYFIIRKLSYLVEDMIEFLELEWLDSLGGGVIGFAQFLIISGVIISITRVTGILDLIPESENIKFAYFVSETSTRVIDLITGTVRSIQI